ncbi:hypothetical protein Tsubulata_043713 [Turnera subulata]|uniref:DUF4283 domain-containing protein n=1 Tax=Turnera subulata TaxID=218843 RepID=A0A9Q0J434_9ROSI|nr:hypothetical protein Tsubulata_043713 [Turnera subulata]
MDSGGPIRLSSTSLPLVDSNGAPRVKYALTMDLIDMLFKAGNQLQRNSKGKNLSASVLIPVISNSTSSTNDARDLGIRVGKLGVHQVDIVSKPQLSKLNSISDPSNSVSPSWADVAKSGINTTVHPLQFVTPVFYKDSNAVTFPPALLEIGRKKFSLCLIGQFMGRAPKIGLISVMATKLWGKQGSILVSPYKARLFLFRFPTESSLSRALCGGPWYIGGVPLFLRQWSQNIGPVDFTASAMPMWVQLQNVPFELLTSEGLSYLANALGKPLHMNQDFSTLFSKRAIVCVEVDYSKPLLYELPIVIDGNMQTIGVSYS